MSQGYTLPQPLDLLGPSPSSFRLHPYVQRIDLAVAVLISRVTVGITLADRAADAGWDEAGIQRVNRSIAVGVAFAGRALFKCGRIRVLRPGIDELDPLVAVDVAVVVGIEEQPTEGDSSSWFTGPEPEGVNLRAL